IRDKLVTGVQTCALPISGALSFSPSLGEPIEPTHRLRLTRLNGSGYLVFGSSPPKATNCLRLSGTQISGYISKKASMDWRKVFRSEERRVGKECSRWWEG